MDKEFVFTKSITFTKPLIDGIYEYIEENVVPNSKVNFSQTTSDLLEKGLKYDALLLEKDRLEQKVQELEEKLKAKKKK